MESTILLNAAFIAAAVRRPSVVGAVAPASHPMARTLAAVVPDGRPVTVVELGPGTGPVSRAIGARLAPGSRHLAVEVDAGMAGRLREAHSWLEVLHGDAADLDTLLYGAGVTGADAVVSTLPWSLFDEPKQRRILDRVRAVLPPGGAFSSVIGLHALALTAGARRFDALLRETFDEADLSRPVWPNLPPSRAWICRRHA